jgi:hypothetical protein
MSGRLVASEKGRMKKWFIGWSLGGLVAPLLYLFVFLISGYTLGEGIFIFWPGAMGLMALNNGPPITMVVLVWLAAIGSNSILYASIGLFLWPFVRRNNRGSG